MAVFGARILLYADDAAHRKEQDRQLRLALLIRGADEHLLFPEVFGAGERKEDDVAADVSQDYGRVEWTAPSSEDEWSRTVAMLAASRVQVPTAEASGGWV